MKSLLKNDKPIVKIVLKETATAKVHGLLSPHLTKRWRIR